MRSAKGRLRLRVTLRFVCPFCGADAMMLEGGVALAHTLPMCASCGAFSTPYSVLIDDPLFCHVVFYRPDRREPLCLVCTIRTAQEFHAKGKVVDTRLGWALNERPIALSGVMTRVGVSNG